VNTLTRRLVNLREHGVEYATLCHLLDQDTSLRPELKKVWCMWVETAELYFKRPTLDGDRIETDSLKDHYDLLCRHVGPP
jgi:hypothetical protein